MYVCMYVWHDLQLSQEAEINRDAGQKMELDILLPLINKT